MFWLWWSLIWLIDVTDVFTLVVSDRPGWYIYILYLYKCSLPNPVPEGHTETLQLTFIPRMLAWYIQYQRLLQLSHAPNIVGSIYTIQMFTFQPCARREHRNPLTYIHPQMLAWYIQYQHIFSTVACSQNCWQHIQYKCVILKCPRVRAMLVWIVLFSCHIYWFDIIPPWLWIYASTETIFIPK